MDIVEFAEVVPHGGFGRNDVGLIPAVKDDTVRALREPQMLASEIPGNVHKFDGVKCAATFPRGESSMRRLTMKEILNRDRPAEISRTGGIGGGKTVADMDAEDEVDIFE
jgi:hypothetical protein